MERQVEDKKPDDGGILDKLNGSVMLQPSCYCHLV